MIAAAALAGLVMTLLVWFLARHWEQTNTVCSIIHALNVLLLWQMLDQLRSASELVALADKDKQEFTSFLFHELRKCVHSRRSCRVPRFGALVRCNASSLRRRRSAHSRVHRRQQRQRRQRLQRRQLAMKAIRSSLSGDRVAT